MGRNYEPNSKLKELQFGHSGYNTSLNYELSMKASPNLFGEL